MLRGRTIRTPACELPSVDGRANSFSSSERGRDRAGTSANPTSSASASPGPSASPSPSASPTPQPATAVVLDITGTQLFLAVRYSAPMRTAIECGFWAAEPR